MMPDPAFFGHNEPAEQDLPISGRPVESGMRDGINIWFFEENGDFGVPRLAVDAVTPDWDNRVTCANFAFRGGRVLDGRGTHPSVPVADENGKNTILGNSVLQFRCLEPHGQWRVTYEDDVIDSTSAEQIARAMDDTRRTRIRLDAVITQVPPRWGQFYSIEDVRPEAGWMGRGWRYEVPCNVSGTLEIDGKPRNFKANGNLIRRKSRRTDSLAFPGHCWLAAHFPDGRAFGCNVYPVEGPTADHNIGKPHFNTGYLFQNGKVREARVVHAPWLRDLIFEGEDMTVVLETELGLTTIKGESLLSTFMPAWPSMGGVNLHQGGVRFTWDDQTAIGMTERSSKPV